MAFKIKKILTFFKKIVVIIIVLNNVSIVHTQNTSLNNNNEIKISETSHKNSSIDIPNLNNILRINSERTIESVEDGSVLLVPKIKIKESAKIKTVDEDNKPVEITVANQNGSSGDDPVLSILSSVKDVGEMDRGSWTKLSWLMELFDHHKWEKKHFANVSSNCTTDMLIYINALKDGEIWAAKMSDASGRYNGQFFFGNDFWLGSSSLCKELQVNLGRNQVPPFAAGFSVAKLQMSVGDYTPKVRSVLMGICMPSSCSPLDLQSILKSGAKEAEIAANSKMEDSLKIGANITRENVELNVVHVRPVPGPYDMWNDVKFSIVGGVAAVAIFLILVASAFEGYVNHHNDSITYKCNDVETDNNNMANGNSASNGKSGNNGSSGNGGGSGNASSNTGNDAIGEVCDKGSRPKTKIGTGIFSQVLLAFSALSNTEKIMKTEESSEDAINCIHGLRFLSLAWVVMVHTYLQVFTVADNKTLRTVIERNFFYQTVGNASYSVDTFFFISGLLVTFLYYKSLENKKIAAAKKNAKLAPQNAGNPTNGGHFGSTVNGDHAKIQMHQYAYVNHAMTSQSHAAIGRTNSNQPITNPGQFPATNTLFTRQTCTKEVKDNVFEFVTLLFYRIVRLTPAYLFVIGFNELVLKYSHNNSVFEPTIIDHITCDKYWWRNVLYINNLFPKSEMCMIWSWYMANDTQFFIIGIILLLISKRHFKVSAGILIVMLISSWFTTGYISIANNYRAKIQQPFEMFDQLYDKPWSRLGPYLVGMMTGCYLWRRRNNLTLPTWVVVIGWPCAMSTMASIVYGMRHGHLELWPTAFYVSIGHTAWSAATAWVVICCVCGRGGLVTRVLSYRGVLPLSRLAYCAYLVHPTVMMLSTYQIDGPVHLHNGMVLVLYAGNTVMSYLMSLAISLAFEAPVVRLLKIDFISSKNKNK